MKDRLIKNINLFERRFFSQHGEDGIIKAIFHKVRTTNKFCVEFGVQDGSVCNTRFLVEKEGWKFLWMDGSDNSPPSVKKEFITAENINSLLSKYQVPERFDLLSIDIDYNTYWVWKALKGYSPRVVVIEYNGQLSPDESKAVAYYPNAIWDQSDYFGASLLAFANLGTDKGYNLVGCDSSGTNAFFVRTDLVDDHFQKKRLKELYKPLTIRSSVKSNKKYVDI